MGTMRRIVSSFRCSVQWIVHGVKYHDVAFPGQRKKFFFLGCIYCIQVWTIKTVIFRLYLSPINSLRIFLEPLLKKDA